MPREDSGPSSVFFYLPDQAREDGYKRVSYSRALRVCLLLAESYQITGREIYLFLPPLQYVKTGRREEENQFYQI